MFCYQKNFFNPTLPVDEAQFYALVRATQWNEAIDKFRETGDQKLKRGLPAFIFQATFDETESKAGKLGAWRKQAATRLTGLVVMDVDHIDDPFGLVNEKLEMSNEKWSALGVLLVYITPSGKGLKIVFKADAKKGNLIDNQHAMAKVLGVEVDESCKDASRMSFICKESDILYIDKELFTYENKEFAEKYDAEYRAGHSGAAAPAAVASANAEQGDRNVSQVADESVPLKWRGYDVQSIIDARYGEKLPCAADSNRHTESLKLATDLLLMLDGDKAAVQRIVESQPWVKEIIDERDENVAQTVQSAAECVAQKEKKYVGSLPSKAMLTAIQKATGRSYVEITKAQAQTATTLKDDDMAQWLWDWGAQIEAMFDDFPILRDICKGLKRNQYPAALIVSGAFEMTLMTRCTYRFYHRPEELRRLNSSALIIGDPASGKSFATRLFKLLAAPIVAADKVGRDAINAYREQMRTKGANKEKPKKPKVVVRVHPARTSNAQFIQDMVNAVEVVDGEEMHLHMLTFDTELDNTVTVQKGGSWIDKQSLELKAFHNEEDGQAYSNTDSILQDFNVYWNYVYTGTPMALETKVNQRNIGTGLATRLAAIPMPSTHFRMMKRETLEEVGLEPEEDKTLRMWAERLDKEYGELPIEKLVHECYEWTARRMADAKDDDSKVEELLCKRVAYYGINVTVPFIVMRHWDEWKQHRTLSIDDTDLHFCQLVCNIQLCCQNYFFGNYWESYFRMQEQGFNGPRQERLYSKKMKVRYRSLPNEFTTNDLVYYCGVNQRNAEKIVERWKSEGYIVMSTYGIYEKVILDLM